MYNVIPNLDEAGCLGIVYDGVNLSEIFEVHDIAIPMLPAMEAVTQEMAGRPGAYYHSRKVKTREIVMKLGLNAQSRCPIDIFHAWREHSGILAKKEPKKLQLKEDAYVMAMLTGETGIENLGYRGVAELHFTCFDPFFYGEEHTVQLSSGSNAVKVRGGVATFPVFQVSGVTGAFTLTNADTGKKVKVAGLTSSTVLRIDMANYRCTVNGNYKAADITVTDFWPIEPGTANLTLSGGSGTMTYRERFL